MVNNRLKGPSISGLGSRREPGWGSQLRVQAQGAHKQHAEDSGNCTPTELASNDTRKEGLLKIHLQLLAFLVAQQPKAAPRRLCCALPGRSPRLTHPLTHPLIRSDVPCGSTSYRACWLTVTDSDSSADSSIDSPSHLEKAVMCRLGCHPEGLDGFFQRRVASRFTLLAIQYRSVSCRGEGTVLN